MKLYSLMNAARIKQPPAGPRTARHLPDVRFAAGGRQPPCKQSGSSASVTRRTAVLFVGGSVPRLTDARKELRRAQIAEAAVRCFGRNGMERTSIADITAESGLSAGSIYAHYRNKAELVQASARAVLAERAAVIGEWAAGDTPPDPDELLARLITAKDPAAARVAVQTWGEATTDPAIRAIVVDMIEQTRAMLHDCVTAWLIKAHHHDPAEARERAAPIAARVSALYLAELLHAALRPPLEETPS
jgi:AcrR family transcriptional regulator